MIRRYGLLITELLVTNFQKLIEKKKREKEKEVTSSILIFRPGTQK